MKLKKLTIIFLLAIILASQINWITFNNYSYAAEDVGKFHYNQLQPDAKIIYNAMHNMYIQGILKTGEQDYDLVEHGLLTEDQVKEYENGNSSLNSAMNAARYAFYADYPEVFYVNFSYLTIRTTKDADNKYHAYIGSGRRANYYTPGFNSQEEVEVAIRDFETRVNEIVEKAKNLEVAENKNKEVEQIKLVHNEIIYNTGYRLESDCTEGNEGFIGTPYGALVKKQAVCEGYSRAFKTVLDRLGINCILVQGLHQSEGFAAVPHMWNYVQIDAQTSARSNEKVWYAVDATLDDPYTYKNDMDMSDKEPGANIIEGFENTRYCLVGKETMNKEHTALETVEAAGNYVFKYPELADEDHGSSTVVNENGLLVEYKQEGTQTVEFIAGDYYVSYNGKGYIEAAKEGKYILAKYYQYLPGDEKWVESPWAYFLPDFLETMDQGDYLHISLPHAEYVEFAVTTLAPEVRPDGYPIDFGLYKGDKSDFIAQSGKLHNLNGTYKSKPYIKTQSPAPTQTLDVGPTYHVDVTYDDDLVLANGATEVGYKTISTGPTGADKSEITNFQFDGKRRIQFDLKFSKMYADDGARYSIYITGLVGKNSGKAPLEISYGASNDILCAFRMNKAQNWEVFARPTLLENEDLSMNGWVTKDGTQVSDKLKSRIALVTTRTTSTEKETMNDLIENNLPTQELITSETYNISLNVCKNYVVKTGHRLRLALGFPAGYGPEDEGVTFKAYHFMRNDKDEIIGVEEIPCVITQYGLIVTCDSFSPFAIAVVEKDETTEPQDKAVIISATEGGVINGANRDEGNIITLSENASRELTIVPDEGYEIETITFCGKKIDVTNKETMKITVNYEDVKDGDNIVYATFIAKEVLEKEEERHESVVEPIVTSKPTIQFTTSITKADDKVIRAGDEFEVNVKISNLNSIEKGLIALGGQLKYDTNILERIDIVENDNWNIGGGFNEENFKFVTDNDSYISNDSTIFTIKFKANEDIETTTKTLVEIKDIVASNAIEDITSKDAQLELEILRKADRFTSEEYLVEDGFVSKITVGTTVAEFKANVETYPNVVIKNKAGATLNDNDVIATGMTLEIGDLRYTLVVTGDTNGDGEITVTDLAQLKLHYIEKEFLSGADLKAADMNYDNNVSMTDLAQIKLVLIGPIE